MVPTGPRPKAGTSSSNSLNCARVIRIRCKRGSSPKGIDRAWIAPLKRPGSSSPMSVKSEESPSKIGRTSPVPAAGKGMNSTPKSLSTKKLAMESSLNSIPAWRLRSTCSRIESARMRDALRFRGRSSRRTSLKQKGVLEYTVEETAFHSCRRCMGSVRSIPRPLPRMAFI